MVFHVPFEPHTPLKRGCGASGARDARGWTRGGEIYLWTSKDGNERELPRYHHSNF